MVFLLLRPWLGRTQPNGARLRAEAEYERLKGKRKHKKTPQAIQVVLSTEPPLPKISKAQIATINDVAQLLTANFKPRPRKDTRKQELARAIDIVTNEIIDDSGLIIALVLIDDD